MKQEQIVENLLYPSVELQVLGQTKPIVDEEHKQLLEVQPAKEVICPKCGNKGCYKRGNRRANSKEYSCIKCKKYFVIHSLVDDEGREIKCPDCQSKDYLLKGRNKVNNKQIYKCKDCHRQYILNPGIEDNLNTINCRWCGSKTLGLLRSMKLESSYVFVKIVKKTFTVGAERPDILIAPERI